LIKRQKTSSSLNVLQYFAATLLPAAILLGLGFSYIKTLNTDISLSKSELAMLPALQPLYQDILNLQKIRGLQYLAATTHDPSLQKEINSLQKKFSHIHKSIYFLYPGIEKELSNIHSKTNQLFSSTKFNENIPDQIFDDYSSLIFEHILLLQNIARESKLLLDPDLDVSMLVEISITRIPAITEIMGQLRGRSSAWLYNGEIKDYKTQIEYMFQSAKNELKLLQAVISSLSKHQEIETILNKSIISDTLANYLTQFHSTLQLPPTKQQSKTLFMIGSEVIASIHNLNKQVVGIITLRLNTRIQQQYNKQYAAMFSIFIALLSMAYFISKFYRTNRDSFSAEIIYLSGEVIC